MFASAHGYNLYNDLLLTIYTVRDSDHRPLPLIHTENIFFFYTQMYPKWTNWFYRWDRFHLVNKSKNTNGYCDNNSNLQPIFIWLIEFLVRQQVSILLFNNCEWCSQYIYIWSYIGRISITVYVNRKAKNL